MASSIVVGVVLSAFAYGTGWRQSINEAQPSLAICKQRLVRLEQSWSRSLPADARINMGCRIEDKYGRTEQEQWGHNCLRWGKCFQNSPDFIITVDPPTKSEGN